MNRILSVAFAVVLGVSIPQAGGAQVPAGDRAEATGPARAQEKITLQLRAAKARDVFQMLAEIMGVTLDIDSAVDQLISSKIQNVGSRTVLTALCDSIGSQCRLDDKRLVVRRATRPPQDGTPASSKDPSASGGAVSGSIRLQGAAIAQVLDFISDLARGSYVMDEALAGRKVSIEARDVTWQEALDLICAQAGCRWETVSDASRVILVRPR